MSTLYIRIPNSSSTTTADVNLVGINGVAPSVGNGIATTGTLRVAIASDNSPVPVSFTPSGTQDVNITKYGGTSTTLGQKAMTASIPVVIASDQSAVAVSGTVAVTQSTSPWVVSGTISATQGTSPWVISGTVATSNFPTTVDTNYGTVGASTIRTAAQIGNATGAAAFNAGTTTSQTLRVVLPTDQTSIPVTQSTSPWVISGTVTVSNLPTTLDTNFGTVGANTLRSAAQIGNATGAASFGAGTISAQTLRVVLPTDQTVIPETPSPDATATYALTNIDSTVLEASHVLKASAGKLFTVTGYNNNSGRQFVQLFNSTTVPADGAVPVVTFLVAATANFSLDYGRWGRYFSTGIAISNSSTAATKTIGSADCWFSTTLI